MPCQLINKIARSKSAHSLSPSFEKKRNAATAIIKSSSVPSLKQFPPPEKSDDGISLPKNGRDFNIPPSELSLCTEHSSALVSVSLKAVPP